MPSKDKDKFEGLVPEETTDDATLFDQLFNKAVERHLSEQDMYPSREALKEEVSFTPGFEDRMKAEIRRWEKSAKRKKRYSHFTVSLLKTASVIFVFVLISGLFVVTSRAARNKVLNFFMQFSDISTDIGMFDDSMDEADMVLMIPEGVYRPAYLPEGFVIELVSELGNATELMYVNGDKTVQISTYTTTNSITLNRENAIVSEFECLDVIATQIKTEKETIIYFKKDEELVVLNANISAKLLRKIAQSLTK